MPAKTSFYNPMRTFSLIFLMLGIILFITGIFNINQIKLFYKNAVPIQATIINKVGQNKASDIRDTLISFEVDGIIYDNISLGRLLREEIGAEVTVYYNKNNPSIIQYELPNYSMGIVTLVFGILFSISAGLAYNRVRHRDKEVHTLLKSNHYTMASVLEMHCNTSIRVRGKNPYYLICKNRDQEYISDNIWQALQDDIIGKPVSIYHPQNAWNPYFVDFRVFLKKGEN